MTINLPAAYCDKIEDLLNRGFYPSRSELIRNAVKQFLETEYEFIKFLRRKEKKVE